MSWKGYLFFHVLFKFIDLNLEIIKTILFTFWYVYYSIAKLKKLLFVFYEYFLFVIQWEYIIVVYDDLPD